MFASLFQKMGPKALLLALALPVLVGSAAPAWSADKVAAGRTPKIREVVDLPEDYLGKTFTYTVKISTNQLWMKRGGDLFFIFVQDAEGNKLPNQGFSPDSTVNRVRFYVSKEDGRKLIDRLNATQTYEARITFTIDRQPAFLGQGWDYLGRITSVELK